MTHDHVLLPPGDSELLGLVDAMCDGAISPEECVRLESLLERDREAKLFYVAYLDLHAQVQWLTRGKETGGERPEADETEVGHAWVPVETDFHQPAPGISPSTLHSPLSTFGVPLSPIFQGWPLAYLIATVVLGVGLTIAAVTHVSPPAQIAHHSVVPLRSTIVGRVTGMVGCVLKGRSDRMDPASTVSLGDKLTLQSGMLEITYDTGAIVILQGPVTYEVDSADSGYLAVGKLTARVEKNTEYRVLSTEYSLANPDESNPQSPIPNPSPLSPLPSPLFTISTPTAVVTDLGTEFGVEVDKSGFTRSYVFRGSVRVVTRNANVANPSAQEDSVVLEKGDAAVVQPGDAETRQLVLLPKSEAPTTKYVRTLQKRIPIILHNTGAGLKEGDADPHWQIVAASNDPKFQPRKAVVTPATPIGWLPNEPLRSQWISLGRDSGDVPNGVTYTFRTHFELDDVAPESVVLIGWFVVDNHVRVMRLNGREIPVPRHSHEESFSACHRITIRKGFVAGTNVLEVDVENGTPGAPEPGSPMAFRMDLEATGQPK